MSWFKNCWALDPNEALESADNPRPPFQLERRRDMLPLLTLAYWCLTRVRRPATPEKLASCVHL